MESTTSGIVRMRNVRFDPELFRNYMSGTVLDELLCSYKGLPKGVNYMVIGDPGVGKTTIILDLLSNIKKQSPGVRVLFISAEMNEIDLAIYVQRFPKFQDLDILFIEASFDEDEPVHNFEKVKDVLKQGWDIVAVDSFYELQGIIKEEDLKVAALANAFELFPDAGLPVNSVSLHTMTQYIADEAHFKEVIARVPNVKRSLWIGTADIKDLYVGDRPFLGILADLISKGREVRLIHAKEPGPNFREDFDRYPVLFTGLERALCPRVHFKMIIFDCKVAYFGSANLTGAGIGMKGATTRNFEAGILTDDPALVEAAMNQFDSVWAGFKCKDCRRKQYCGDPILK